MNQQVGAKAHPAPMERIFASGMREFIKLRERRLDAVAQLDGARRAMRASYQREMDVIESHLSFLASVGSVSPYVGLFGTVWGIMHAFVGLSNMQQVTLATVAPGIAEALVATAIGLFAAIPAVVAYNRFARQIDRIAIQLETFIEEFVNILQRNADHRVGAAPDSEVAAMPGTVSRGRGRRAMNEINMVPFIDVMLVLLIIFMVTAPLITTGVVDLPSVGQAQPGRRPRWSRSSSARTNGCRFACAAKAAATRSRWRSRRLVAQVRALQGGNADTPVVISADRNVKYDAVVRVMDRLQKGGVQRVGLSVAQGR